MIANPSTLRVTTGTRLVMSGTLRVMTGTHHVWRYHVMAGTPHVMAGPDPAIHPGTTGSPGRPARQASRSPVCGWPGQARP